MFSSRSFVFSGFTFRSLIHFEFFSVYGVRKCSNFILLHVTIQFSQHFDSLCMWRFIHESSEYFTEETAFFEILYSCLFVHRLIDHKYVGSLFFSIDLCVCFYTSILMFWLLLLFSCWVVSDFWNPMDSSLPGSSVHAVLQARILGWVAISSPRDIPRPRIEPTSPALIGGSLTPGPSGKLFDYCSFAI